MTARAGNQYGPHREQDAPTHVEIKTGTRYAAPEQVPIAPQVLRQRARINHRAHEDTKR